jgi:ABC-type ATPase involved in cell division
MISTIAPIIELKGPVLASSGSLQLTINQGDVINIVSDAPADVRRVLRVLATLERPEEIEYRFNGRPLDLQNYRCCLDVKRRIGYVAADAAMISNRTIRENLLLTRYYLENDLSIDIDAAVMSLCRSAGLSGKLDQRPAALSEAELRKAVAIREMAKAPVVMLLERPEDYILDPQDNDIFNHLEEMVRSGTAVVYFSSNNKMNALANRQLKLGAGAVRTGSA